MFQAVRHWRVGAGDDSDLQEDPRAARDIRRVTTALGLAMLVSVLALAGTAWGSVTAWRLGLWAVAAIGAGALVGFLFGIPRAQAPAPAEAGDAGAAPPAADPKARTDSGLRPNTNLEEVSDWLTKIIVGLGLVNLQALPGKLTGLASVAALALAPQPTATDVSITLALLVGFAIEGFFGGYIYTRLFLQGAFVRSDNALRAGEVERRRKVAQAVAAAPAGAAPDGEQPDLPSPAQREAATEVQRVTEGDRRAAADKLDELAREYERVRGSMAPGPRRTRQMSEVVSRMTVLALAAQGELKRLTESGLQGDRLAAITILKLRFQAGYIGWLADRVAEDPPFIGFHAASALLAGWRDLGPAERDEMKRAVELAQQQLHESGRDNDPPRDRLLQQIVAGQAPAAW